MSIANEKREFFFYKRKYVKTTILNVKEPLLRSDLCCPPAVCPESETQYQIYYIAIGKHDAPAAIESQLKFLKKHRTDWEHFMFWLMFWNPFIVYTLYHSIPFGSYNLCDSEHHEFSPNVSGPRKSVYFFVTLCVESRILNRKSLVSYTSVFPQKLICSFSQCPQSCNIA